MRISAFEMCYWRILKLDWPERVTNEEVRRVHQRESLMNTIVRKKLRFAGCVLRGCGSLA